MEDNDITSLDQVDYPGGFYREQSPVHLNYICALNGIKGPDLDAGFTYCELGCGTGETTACLASCHPGQHFFGIDISSLHIDQAEALANAGGLSNTTFIQADIANIAFESLPDFDFITLHGLYSWVPKAVQNSIRNFIAAKLKPGGVVYLSYNAMPGWGSVAPMQRFFVDQASLMSGSPLAKAQEIVATLQRLREQGAPYFHDNPVAAGILTRLQSADARYIAHEYLSESWGARYFSDVYDELTTTGLEFVGEGDIVNNLLQHSVAPAFAEYLGTISNTREREAQRDFIQNRFFRRDIYIKPDPSRRTTNREYLLRPMLFGLIADPAQIPETINIVGAPSVELRGAWLDRLKKLIGYRIMTLDEILGDEQLRGFNHAELIEGITLLTAGGFCVPCLRGETEPSRRPADRIKVSPELNRARLERHAWSEAGFTLVSPVTGSAVTLNRLETALLISLQRHNPLDWLWPELEKREMKLVSIADQKTMPDENASRTALGEAMSQFLRYKLPKLAYLGMIEPA